MFYFRCFTPNYIAVSVLCRWFWHFYAVSVLWNGLLLILLILSVFVETQLPDFLTNLLTFLTGQANGTFFSGYTVSIIHVIIPQNILYVTTSCLSPLQK